MKRCNVGVCRAGTARRWCLVAGVLGLGLAWASLGLAQAPSPAVELDKKIMALAQKDSQAMTNLTYLSDMIGPRLTGSAALKRANQWTAAKMKEYGLTNVHTEAWSMPEGWERGSAAGRIIDPDNGRTLSLAAMGWSPGTNGKIQGDVLILKAKNLKELEPYKGKLKNAIILAQAPVKLTPIADIEKGSLFPTGLPSKGGKDNEKKEKKDRERKGGKFSSEEMRAFQRELSEFLRNEGVAVMLRDAGKHHGLLFTTGSWAGKDRPSASSRLPSAYVAHEHYSLLYRLASRPAPARTRVEIEITNKFIPGPIAVYNTVGEIKGSDKADEVVVLGAHLDSWDLGQGTLDNGTGTTVVLESARILAQCGVTPRRTIRFILFTGEEQGLHGSRAYVDQHKDELAKISACLCHDTGTGKVIGMGWMGKSETREERKGIVDAALASLKELGVGDLHARGFGGSDHMSFASKGVPACIFRQEIAGYRFGHHSQADTLTLAREPDIIQGAQVMALTAMRLANLDQMLPREAAKSEKAAK